MRRSLSLLVFPALLAALAVTGPLEAQNKRLWPAFSATGGVYALSTSDHLRLDGNAEIRGTTVDWEQDFGLPETRPLLALSATWQFAGRQSLSVEYFSYDQSGSKSIARELVIGGVTYPAGVDVSARLKVSQIEGLYTYWFMRREKLGVGGSFGLVVLGLDADASATVQLAGNQGSETRRYSARADPPVPMIGLALKGNPRDRFVWGAAGRFLPSVSIGNNIGHAVTYGASAEFYVLAPLSVGVGYTGRTVTADFDISGRGRVDLTASGWRAFLRIAP